MFTTKTDAAEAGAVPLSGKSKEWRFWVMLLFADLHLSHRALAAWLVQVQSSFKLPSNRQLFDLQAPLKQTHPEFEKYIKASCSVFDDCSDRYKFSLWDLLSFHELCHMLCCVDRQYCVQTHLICCNIFCSVPWWFSRILPSSCALLTPYLPTSSSMHQIKWTDLSFSLFPQCRHQHTSQCTAQTKP